MRSLLAGRMELVAVSVPASVDRHAGRLQHLPLVPDLASMAFLTFPAAVLWDASSAAHRRLQESSSQGETGAGQPG